VRRALSLLVLLAAFASASVMPCPSVRLVRADRSHTAIAAECPCHCGDHRASSASRLDPVLRSEAPVLAGPAWTSLAPEPALAPLAVALPTPDPVPILVRSEA